MKIKKILAREIYNSRGWPTVQCEVVLDDDHSVYASVPTGLSCGKNEAKKIYDEQDRLLGRGVLQSVEYIEKIIAPELVGLEPHAVNMDIKMIELDGSQNKSNLGANTLLAVSMAIYRAHAYAEGLELYEFIGHVCGAETVSLPFPLFNVINGGIHAENNLVIQEFMIVPVGGTCFRTSLEIAATIFHILKDILKKYNKKIVFGDEGGYASNFTDEREALDIMVETLEHVRSSYGYNALIALDVAASHFYDEEIKQYRWNDKMLMTEELVDRYEQLINDYPICSIEDGLSEDDWEGWSYMMERLKGRVQIVGDDIFATNPGRISEGFEKKTATALIIKPDQIGTITEALQAIRLGKEHEIITVMSHRSGDTEDSFIADMAVGASTEQIKSGGLSRSERLAKYNRLLVIEDHLSAE